MILRKPYAFLIKHFRLIHLFMFVLMAYMTYKANNMLSFFKDYIEANGIIGVAESSYFSILIFIAGFLVIVLSVTVFFLMRYKKKPRTLYIVIAVISAIAMGLFVYLHGNIRTLETTVMTGRSVRLLRDISRFNFWLLFVMCIPLIVRGLGFDIRKFNFNKDLQELKLDEKVKEIPNEIEDNSQSQIYKEEYAR